MKIHKLYDVYPLWDEDTQEETYLLTGYGEMEGSFLEFELEFFDPSLVYEIQTHFRRPTLDAFEIDNKEIFIL